MRGAVESGQTVSRVLDLVANAGLTDIPFEGQRMARYEFIGRPPRSFVVVFVLTFTNFWIGWTAGAFREFWARQSSDAVFTYPIRFKGGHTWYFVPVVGRYIEWSFVGHFIALALLGLICFQHRDRWVRRSS